MALKAEVLLRDLRRIIAARRWNDACGRTLFQGFNALTQGVFSSEPISTQLEILSALQEAVGKFASDCVRMVPLVEALGRATTRCARDTETQETYNCYITCLDCWVALVEVGSTPKDLWETLQKIPSYEDILLELATELCRAKTMLAQDLAISIVCSLLFYLQTQHQATAFTSLASKCPPLMKSALLREDAGPCWILLNKTVFQGVINANNPNLRSFHIMKVAILMNGKPQERKVMDHGMLDIDTFSMEVDMGDDRGILHIPYGEITRVHCAANEAIMQVFLYVR